MEKQKTIFKDKSGYFVEQNGERIQVKPTDQKGQDESKWTFTDGENTYTPSQTQEKRAEYSSAYDPYALTDLLDWTAENTIGLPIKWAAQTQTGQKALPYVGKILSVAQPSKWYGTFTGKGAPWSEKNTGFGDSKHDKSLNTLVDWALSPALVKGEGAVAKSVGSKIVWLAKPHIVGAELLKAAKRWDGTVGKSYFNNPDKWYRVTESPEVQAIEYLGKNATTRDAQYMDIPIDRWRLSVINNALKPVDGGWLVPSRTKSGTRLILTKTGQAHGNTSQAAKGQIWGGTFAASHRFPGGILEGNMQSQVYRGFNPKTMADSRSHFVLQNWKDIPQGARIGFHTGEMPIEGLTWFQRLPNGRYSFRDVLPAKRIDLTPQTSISKQQVNTPFKGQLRNYLTESGESIIYDDGQYVLKEKSLYDVNSSIDKLYHNVSRDLAMNKIPGIQPIEYLGYKVNTNPQKIVNGLTGEIETKLNKTYDPIYRQRKIIPLNDPKTIFLDQPTSHKLLDHYGIKHDKDFGYVGDITFSDFGLKNWGIDDYGRYRLFDPMIHDF